MYSKYDVNHPPLMISIIPEFLYPFLSLHQRQLTVGLSFRHLSLAVIYIHEVSYLQYSVILIVKLQRVTLYLPYP